MLEMFILNLCSTSQGYHTTIISYQPNFEEFSINKKHVFKIIQY